MPGRGLIQLCVTTSFPVVLVPGLCPDVLFSNERENRACLKSRYKPKTRTVPLTSVKKTSIAVSKGENGQFFPISYS